MAHAKAEIVWNILTEFRWQVIKEAASIARITLVASSVKCIPGGAKVRKIDIISEILIVQIGIAGSTGLSGAATLASWPIEWVSHAIQTRSQAHVGEDIVIGILKTESLLKFKMNSFNISIQFSVSIRSIIVSTTVLFLTENIFELYFSIRA